MLIYCTNCGKPISDQAKVCPHCNFVFADVVEKQNRQTVDYMTLPQDQKDRLVEEFSKDYPMHGMNIAGQANSKKKDKVFSIIGLVLGSLMVAVIFFMFSDMDNLKGSEPPMLFWVVMILFVGFMVMFIITMVQRKKGGGNYESLKSHKYFELWLKKRGYDNYQVNLTSENKKYMYKNIEIDEEIK